MRYEIRPCVGEKIKYYIVRHKWWWTDEMRLWKWLEEDRYTFDQRVNRIVYFDTAQEAKMKAIELFGTYERSL